MKFHYTIHHFTVELIVMFVAIVYGVYIMLVVIFIIHMLYSWQVKVVPRVGHHFIGNYFMNYVQCNSIYK